MVVVFNDDLLINAYAQQCLGHTVTLRHCLEFDWS